MVPLPLRFPIVHAKSTALCSSSTENCHPLSWRSNSLPVTTHHVADLQWDKPWNPYLKMICLDTRTTVLACPQLCTSSLKILPDRSCMYYSHSQGLNYFVQLAGNPMPCYHYICQKSSIQIILSSLLVYDTGCWCRGPERRHAQWPNLTAHRLAPTTTQAWPLVCAQINEP